MKDRLRYDPETGHFWWLVRPSNRVDITKPAGSILKRADGTPGYKQIKVGGSMHLQHRLAFVFMGHDLPDHVDHINGDVQDNRWCNLRPATPQQNSMNRGKQKNNTSGFKGVCEVRPGRFRATLGQEVIGEFRTAKEAADAYKKAGTARFGEFLSV